MAEDDQDPHSDQPPGQGRGAFSRQFAMAMELPFLLAGSIFLGGLFGYLLDRWLGTKPFLLLIFGAMGLAAGVREVVRRLPAGGNGGKRDDKR